MGSELGKRILGGELVKRDWGGGLRKRDWSESEASNTKTCYGKHLQIVWHRNTSLVSNLDIGQ